MMIPESIAYFMAGAFVAFFGSFIVVPLILAVMRLLGFYTIVREGRCHVYVFFGKVIGVLDKPGFNFLWFALGWKAFFIHFLGKLHVIDRRVDQCYLRSQPVNSEEGAPMGIGIWYEMFISDPVAYLFKNADPEGSLAANVSNAVVRTLSNMPLAEMLENRHGMSQAVREEVTEKSDEWGYHLGSVYIRKVHFRDAQMIKQIEEKVVNRLRQVTSAIKQDGVNQVNIITSSAERQAAVEFAKSEAMRPLIVGKALQQINQDPEIAKSLFEILEIQNLLEGNARISLIPEQSGLMAQLLATRPGEPDAPVKVSVSKPVKTAEGETF